MNTIPPPGGPPLPPPHPGAATMTQPTLNQPLPPPTTFTADPAGVLDESPAPGVFERLGLERFDPVTLGLLTAAAVAGNLSLRAGVANLGALLTAVLAAGAFVKLGVSRSVRGAALLASAVLVAIWLPIRASWTLTALNALTIVGLFGAAALLHNVRPVRLSMELIGAQVARTVSALFGPFLVLASLVPGRRPGRGTGLSGERTWQVLRGLALAAIPVLVLGALLASADAVFASLFSIDVADIFGVMAGHLFLTLFVGGGLSVLAAAAQGRAVEDAAETRFIGRVEALIVVSSVAALYLIFTGVQVVTALGGARHILDTEGLTRAEYARSGFFQLLAAAALTIGLVTGLQAVARRTSGRSEPAMRVAATLVSLLTLGIVVVSLSRLWLYIDVFGLTELRLLSTAFAVLLGVVFVLLATSSALGGQKSWFWWGSLAAALAVLVGLNLVNYEARIVDWNLAHQDTVDLDVSLLWNLSPDAVPTLHDQAPDLALPEWTCGDAGEDRPYGPFGFNVGRWRAERSNVDVFGGC